MSFLKNYLLSYVKEYAISNLINLPCWFKPRPLGRKDRPATSVAMLLYRADWGGDADPFPIFGFIPTGCFLIALLKPTMF
jgi:hypothetical protein